MATIPEALAIAMRHHQAGRLHEAEPIYRQILTIEPAHADACHLLGIIAYQQGQHDTAVGYFERAIKSNREVAEYHNVLGLALRPLGQADRAIGCFQRAAQLKPDFAEAHNNLGDAYRAQDKIGEALACYQRALELKPGFAEGHNNLGIVCKLQGKLNDAASCFQRAIQLNPDYAAAHNNLGNIWLNLGRLDAAAECYQRALQLNPDYADACYNLASVWQTQNKLDTAIACFERTLQLKPDFVAALAALVNSLQHVCQWENLTDLARRVVEGFENGCGGEHATPVSPSVFLFLPIETTTQQQLLCAQQWADRKLKGAMELGRRQSTLSRRSKAKLTIGYFSADFRVHPLAYTIVELMEKHDRERFAVMAYSYGPDDGSPIRRRIMNACDKFVDLQHASFTQAAERIASDEVDILVDLTGYTQYARTEVVALRPAPVQVNYWGYSATMGASFIDYILVDDFAVPAGQGPFFTEKLVSLPGCHVPSDSQCEISPHSPSKAECGLPDEGFVFCSFNNTYKFTPRMFDVWMDLLKAVPGSVLWLFAGNRFVPDNLRKEARSRGVAAERLVFAPWLPMPEYLARYRLADLFLDTFPYNAHTTARDALWAGCPVLTRTGETLISRIAGSFLRAIGLPKLITSSLEEYHDLALQLARNPGRLVDLRARLDVLRRTSVQFDGVQFARNIEHAYTTMWEIHAAGELPRSFAVGPS